MAAVGEPEEIEGRDTGVVEVGGGGCAMIARTSKIIMCLCMASFALLCAGDNVFDHGANFDFVRHVLSMDTTFHDPLIMGRAVAAPALWHAGFGCSLPVRRSQACCSRWALGPHC